MSRKWSAMTFICIICPMSYVLLNILASVAGMCIVYVGLNILESDFVQRVAAPGLAPQNYEINLKKELKHVKRVIRSTEELVGSWFTLLGVCGVLTLVLDVKCLYVIYGDLMLATLIIYVLVVLVCYNYGFGDEFGEATTYLFKYLLKMNYYCDPLSPSHFSNFVNRMQVELECCGMDSYEDYKAAVDWRDMTKDAQVIPASCCHLNKTAFRNEARYQVDTIFCARSPTENNSNMNFSCYAKIEGLVMQDISSIQVLVVVLFFVMVYLVGLTFSLLLYGDSIVWPTVRKLFG